MKQGTQSQCSGTTQRDRVGRKVGGGFRMGLEGVLQNTEAEAAILWPPDSNSWLTGKYPDARKD